MVAALPSFTGGPGRHGAVTGPTTARCTCVTRRISIGIFLAVLTFGAAGCGGSTAQPPAPTPAAVPSAVPVPTSAVAAVPPQSSWKMPNLVGSNLQEAQDAIQALTAFGVAVTTSHDVTGAGRQQVLDRNWQVCSQNIPPGATITTSTMIDFGAVKLSERC